MEKFPKLHSDVREATNAFVTTKSEAIEDEVFMRAFLCKVIDVPVLQTHTKELVTDMGGTLDGHLFKNPKELPLDRVDRGPEERG